MNASPASFLVSIFYKYTPIQDPTGLMEALRAAGEQIGILGRFLIATEGINGTFEGTPEATSAFSAWLHAQDGLPGTFADLSDVWVKSSPGTGKAFRKLKVKVRREIVATGLQDGERVIPWQDTGKHLSAEELKAWYEAGEEFEIIDMRNDYEYAVGHFRGSRESGMKNYRDLKEIAKRHEDIKQKKVLTVCTYGVRCETASAYLKKQGFENVYQLHGGIGTYMKEFPGQDFEGSLYVFDGRITEQFTDAYKVIGTCVACHASSERFGNCANAACHKQLIICEGCSASSVWCAECEPSAKHPL